MYLRSTVKSYYLILGFSALQNKIPKTKYNSPSHSHLGFQVWAGSASIRTRCDHGRQPIGIAHLGRRPSVWRWGCGTAAPAAGAMWPCSTGGLLRTRLLMPEMTPYSWLVYLQRKFSFIFSGWIFLLKGLSSLDFLFLLVFSRNSENARKGSWKNWELKARKQEECHLKRWLEDKVRMTQWFIPAGRERKRISVVVASYVCIPVCLCTI